MRRTIFAQTVVWYMIAVMIVFGFAPRVEAGFIASQSSQGSQTNRAEDLGTIQKALEMRMVSETLEKYGMTKAEVKTRLDGMADAQLHELATNLDEVRVGGDGWWAVIAILIIVVLVIVIVQLTGHRVVVQ